MKTITIRYGIEKMTRSMDDDVTVADLKEDAQFRAGLGYGDNVRILQNGVELPDEASVSNGAELVAETACNSKAQDQKTVVVRYGVDRCEKAVAYNTTFGQLKNNSSIRAALGYGDNIRMLVNGIAMADEAVVPNAAEVVIETACNSKAQS
jgi:hypothetical protein